MGVRAAVRYRAAVAYPRLSAALRAGLVVAAGVAAWLAGLALA